MPKVVVHGPAPGSEGGTSAPPEEDGLPLSRDERDRPGTFPRGFSTQARSSRVPDPRPTAPEAGPLLRCNNCGTLGHLPRACPNYGWYYPAPGKTRLDYIKDRQRVQDLIAMDILNEHTVHEDDDVPVVFQGARPTRDEKELALKRLCPGCDQGPGDPCRTAAGKITEIHKARLNALDSPGTGS